MIYIGMMLALEEQGILPHIKRFAGASAGAATAMLAALGCTAAQCRAEWEAVDWGAVTEDAPKGCFQLCHTCSAWRRMGWNPAQKLADVITALVLKYTGNADTTFRQLYEERGVQLAVAMTNVTLLTPMSSFSETVAALNGRPGMYFHFDTTRKFHFESATEARAGCFVPWTAEMVRARARAAPTPSISSLRP